MTGVLRPSLLALGLTAASAQGQDFVPVPSGRNVTFIEAIHSAPGPAGLTVRFRFLAPEIARTDPDAALDETVFEDMAWLCESSALPRLPSIGPQVQQIVVSLADRPLPFGEADPEVTQLFEAYRPENGLCVWEGF